jgi:hypothetical protein
MNDLDLILSTLFTIANDQTLTAAVRSQADNVYQRVTICRRLKSYGAPVRNAFLYNLNQLKNLVLSDATVDELRDAAVVILES